MIIGLDTGSTTVKICVLDEKDTVIFSEYRRHYSDIKKTVHQILSEAARVLDDRMIRIAVTGSGGIGISRWLGISFVQEVVASTSLVRSVYPGADAAIELGGEDAKIIYFKGTMEQRMNGSCAGGTGAFIDQMASLLNTDAHGLDELAKNHKDIYPIASRCGVFAKTDIQPLLNEGASRSDIAASIFQAVVNQTISALACGRPLKGNIVFLGGPLFYLSQLRIRFIKTLGDKLTSLTVPEDAHLFVAMGAAMMAKSSSLVSIDELLRKLSETGEVTHEINRLQPLFEDAADHARFCQRHNGSKMKQKHLSESTGPLYLGIDAGSTTAKTAVIDKDGALLYSYYAKNDGEPLEKIIGSLKEIYSMMPKEAYIGCSCVTGYGEGLVKKALRADMGEIETKAHLAAALELDPEVDFVLDIGGQDMKCLKIKDGIIESIMLNEACSSGCGSFLETFAGNLGMTAEEFAKAGLYAKDPVDLGSRCTVFMNSRVKQAQKEGALLGDISAGLAHSLVKNALNKVIKIRDPERLGKNMIVQGGTFKSDAVLRAFERMAGRNVIRAPKPEIMGALGAAITAGQNGNDQDISTIRGPDELDGLHIKSSTTRCRSCSNQCLLTINTFSGNEKYITGNRCEKGSGGGLNASIDEIPDMFEYKYRRTFDHYKPIDAKTAKRGVIGIPRVLNMYENYPFWFTFFTQLGFSVVLSPESSREIYEMGLDYIPSESVCYPAKISHGHIRHLVDSGVRSIFYPCIMFERKEFKDADDHYNCPIVTSYPEVLAANMGDMKDKGVEFIKPFLPLDDYGKLAKRIEQGSFIPGALPGEIKSAVKKAAKEYERYRSDIRSEGERILSYLKEKKAKGIVLSGKPYHLDPAINHGIPKMIKELGFAVLTEDGIAHLGDIKRKLRVVDQWMYNTRNYAAADFVRNTEELELIQLNSFGCGLDAISTDQVDEILRSAGKIYTCIKIDEGDNLGAARIRIRSLQASLKDREKKPVEREIKDYSLKRRIFSKENTGHTILAPQMSPIHFSLLQKAFVSCGHNIELLTRADNRTVDTGLKYVNNDACYPSIITTGQLIEALESGRYPLERTALLMTQTGGGCRATNYIGFIRKALADAGFENVPVLSINSLGFERHPGFKLGYKVLRRGLKAILFGDLLMKLLYQTRPYESKKGETDLLYEKWEHICKEFFDDEDRKNYKKIVSGMIKDFELIEIDETKKIPRIGLVGEILIKFHPMANNEIIRFLEARGTEVVTTDLGGFFNYAFYSNIYRHRYLSGKALKAFISKAFISYFGSLRKHMDSELAKSRVFDPYTSIYELAEKAGKILSLGNQTGEGWLLVAEMIELIEKGIKDIICVQPFACLPNHVTGKGMIKAIRDKYPEANIVAIDYDPGASEVNQQNRIELMLSSAFEKLGSTEDK